MKHLTKLLAVLLLLTLSLSLFACGTPNVDPVDSQDDETTLAPDAETTAESTAPSVDKELPVRVMALNGTTGFGMAKLMKDKADGNAVLNYNFSVEADAETILKSLINGSVDIAALPTNAAATVYTKTNGAVQMLALNTLGVLYVVANGETQAITDFESLRGKTVYCPANNPAIIFEALCEANGLKVGTDITIDTYYAAPAALRTAVADGTVELAVLPEPMVTIAKKSNAALVTALDLTAEWDKKFPAGSLAQGCVVVRTEFASAHPAEIATFLEEYEASINYMKDNVSEAANVIVEQGVFAGAAPVVAAAIPNCNVTFKAGNDMKAALKVFYEALSQIDGSTVPADNFYYGAD